jgi:hypothetical protein
LELEKIYRNEEMNQSAKEKVLKRNYPNGVKITNDKIVSRSKSGLTQRAATVFKSKSKITIKVKSSPFQAMQISLKGC